MWLRDSGGGIASGASAVAIVPVFYVALHSESRRDLYVVLTGLAGTLLLYAILRLQALLPGYNAAVLVTDLTPDLAMNTAIMARTVAQK